MTGPAPFSILRRFSSRQPAPAASRCDLCGAAIGTDHAHLVKPEGGTIVCSCPACALLFPGRPGARFKRVPPDVLELQGGDDAWSALAVPIGLAFFVRSSAEGKTVAFYPSPAGPTPAPVDSETWRRLVDQVPEVGHMEDDVQALLVHRLEGARDTFIVPIDRCFDLVGRLRLKWRGISGGEEARSEIAEFFRKLREGGTHA
jgi:hypothetical protein